MMGTHIGGSVFIGPSCHLDDRFAELVHIEDGVSISFRVAITVNGESRVRRRVKALSVLIRKNAFVRTVGIILPVVKIGENALVGAAGVVTNDVQYGITVVVPAKASSREGAQGVELGQVV